MPIFRYTARDTFGSKVSGSYDALSKAEVQIYLASAGLTPINDKAIRQSLLKFELHFGTGVSAKEIVVFTRMFGAMYRAGVPITAILQALFRTTKSNTMKQAIQRLIVDVDSGTPYAEALKKQPAIFSPLYTNIIAAGEMSGSLDTLTEDLARLLERSAEIRSKVKGAMVLPSAMLVIAIAVTLGMLTFVLPAFVQVYKDAKVILPAPTRIAMGASHFVVHDWWMILIGVVTVVVGLSRLFKIESIATLRDSGILKIPVLGQLAVKGATARFSRTLGTLIGAGVPLVNAFELTSATAGNKVISKAITSAGESVSKGNPIAKPLEESKVFPVLMTSMVAIGEESGELEQMLGHVATYFEADVAVAVDAALKLIEPAMTIVIGIIVGGLLVAMYMPLINLVDVIK